MPEPLYDSLQCVSGTDFDEVYQILDRNRGAYATWAGTEVATATVHDRAGQLLATMSNTGTPDGTITLASGGLLSLHLPAAFIATLPVTRVYTNSTDVRYAGWRARGVYAFELTVTAGADVSALVVGQFTVIQY